MNADRIAHWYRWLEYAAFGGALQRRRVAFLPEVAGVRRVLLLGEGDGRFLAQFLAKSSEAHVDYIDLSGRMLELARKRAGMSRVTYRRGDALEIPLPEASYDLIVTHFFLDCFDDAEAARLIEHVTRAACPRARWLVSEFRRPGVLVSLLYLFFRVTTGLTTRRLVDHHPLLERHGFQLAREQRAWRGLLASELWTRADAAARALD